MTRLVLLAFLGIIVSFGCSAIGDGSGDQSDTPDVQLTNTPVPTAGATRTPRPTPTSRFNAQGAPIRRAVVPRTTAQAPISAASTLAPTPTPVARNSNQARNLVWGFLSQCVSFDPQDLGAIPVRDDWLVKVPSGAAQQYGTWKVNSVSGSFEAYDSLAQEWLSIVESGCSPESLQSLLAPTPTIIPPSTPTPPPTPRPTTPSPTATPVLKSTSAAVATLWAYLVKCFPTLATTNLESTLDPPKGEYIVKDKGSAVYGVWRVRATDGRISPDNDRARIRDQTVRGGRC